MREMLSDKVLQKKREYTNEEMLRQRQRVKLISYSQ